MHMKEYLPPYPATLHHPVKFFFNGFRSRTPLYRDVVAVVERTRYEQEPIWAVTALRDTKPSGGNCVEASRLVNGNLARELGCRATTGSGQVLLDDPNLVAISSHWWGWIPTSDRGLVIGDITLDQSGHPAPFVCDTPESLAAQGIHYSLRNESLAVPAIPYDRDL
jgi:hypothetical protein